MRPMGRGSRRRAANKARDEETPKTPVNWRRLVSYLGPYKARMAVAIVALIFYSAAGLVFPLVIGQLLSSVFEHKDLNQLNTITVGLIGLFLAQAAFSFVQSYTLTYIGERIVVNLRTPLSAPLHQLSLDFFANRRVGELVSRLSSDVTQVRSVLTNNITQLLSQSISLVGSVVMLFILAPRFMLFIVVLVPIIAAVAIVFGRSLQGLSTEVQDATAAQTGAFEEA